MCGLDNWNVIKTQKPKWNDMPYQKKKKKRQIKNITYKFKKIQKNKFFRFVSKIYSQNNINSHLLIGCLNGCYFPATYYHTISTYTHFVTLFF